LISILFLVAFLARFSARRRRGRFASGYRGPLRHRCGGTFDCSSATTPRRAAGALVRSCLLRAAVAPLPVGDVAWRSLRVMFSAGV
jgi:hypothetical protein